MKAEDIARNYATGIDAAYAKMVKRVGRGEADKWRANSIASAQMYSYAYTKARAVLATGGTEAS